MTVAAQGGGTAASAEVGAGRTATPGVVGPSSLQVRSWSRSGSHVWVAHGCLLLGLCVFLAAQPFIRERGGALFWAFCALAVLHALATARPRVIPALLAYTVIGIAYGALSYFDVLPDAWTVVYYQDLIPRQAFYIVLLYPLVIAAASMWSYAEGARKAPRYFFAVLVATGLVAPVVQTLAADTPWRAAFAGVATGGFGNARLLFFVALAYFLLVGIRNVGMARACTMFVIAASFLGFTQLVAAPQVQNAIGLVLLLALAFIRPTKTLVIGLVLGGLLLYAILIPLAGPVYRTDPNGGYRLLLTRDALRATAQTYGVGVGYGKEVVAGAYSEVGISRSEILATKETLATQGAHNSFAQEYMRLGILGGSCLVWLFFVTCFPPTRGPLRQRRFLTAIYLVLLMSLALDVGLESPTYLVGVAFCIGYIVASKDRLSQTIRETVPRRSSQ